MITGNILISKLRNQIKYLKNIEGKKKTALIVWYEILLGISFWDVIKVNLKHCTLQHLGGADDLEPSYKGKIIIKETTFGFRKILNEAEIHS